VLTERCGRAADALAESAAEPLDRLSDI